MKELSLNILDIAQNSVKAGAKNVSLIIKESDTRLTFSVTDDGCGMTADFLARVTDPFCTTRTTRRVGLGLPFLKLMAEQTGGEVSIKISADSNFSCAFSSRYFTRLSNLQPLLCNISVVRKDFFICFELC
jgi:signal transduction histidine kinase